MYTFGVDKNKGKKRDESTVTVLATFALALVITILVFISINPWLLVGVTPVLLAIAAVIRAVNGRP